MPEQYVDVPATQPDVPVPVPPPVPLEIGAGCPNRVHAPGHCSAYDRQRPSVQLLELTNAPSPHVHTVLSQSSPTVQRAPTEIGEQSPDTQALLLEQVKQAAPFLPQLLDAAPDWHTPEVSQQPLQLLALQAELEQPA